MNKSMHILAVARLTFSVNTFAAEAKTLVVQVEIEINTPAESE